MRAGAMPAQPRMMRRHQKSMKRSRTRKSTYHGPGHAAEQCLRWPFHGFAHVIAMSCFSMGGISQRPHVALPHGDTEGFSSWRDGAPNRITWKFEPMNLEDDSCAASRISSG